MKGRILGVFRHCEHLSNTIDISGATDTSILIFPAIAAYPTARRVVVGTLVGLRVETCSETPLWRP